VERQTAWRIRKGADSAVSRGARHHAHQAAISRGAKASKYAVIATHTAILHCALALARGAAAASAAGASWHRRLKRQRSIKHHRKQRHQNKRRRRRKA